MSDTENIALIDWLTFTTKDLDYKRLINFLGLDRLGLTETRGHNGYKSALQFGGIWVLFDGREDMGVCVEMSGQGCRQYETSGLYNLDYLSDYLARHSDKYNITRLDVAYDDIDHEGKGLLDVRVIDEYARKDLYVSRFRSKSGEWSGKHAEDGEEAFPLAYSVYFGSPQSNTRVRIYDKAMERGGLDYHWTRVELQLRHESALNFLLDEHSVGEKFYGVLNNNLRFVMPNPSDSRRRRWETTRWWEEFLQSALKISVFSKKGVDYNMSRLENYVFGQAGKSIKTFIECKGTVEFYRVLNEFMKDKALNDNQLNLISEYATEKEERLLRYYQNQHKGWSSPKGE
ncbi:MAG: replication initiation factor domain-containing protein [Lachnospiraceae bacterium]|nr:replication initiation factor domain-containing protein [Ruminococcus sp.]MCM1275643.1 replication initiation factor domain-containing protein [Lachnospiraceae bacterium]